MSDSSTRNRPFRPYRAPVIADLGGVAAAVATGAAHTAKLSCAEQRGQETATDTSTYGTDRGHDALATQRSLCTHRHLNPPHLRRGFAIRERAP